MNITIDFADNYLTSKNIGSFVKFFSAIQIYTSKEDNVYYFIDRFKTGEKKNLAIGLDGLDNLIKKYVKENYSVEE